MPRDVDRDEVRRLMDEGAQLVEVLPPKEFEEDHLEGAVNLPLARLEKEARSLLDPDHQVVVYCWDSAWDLSPRAAWRLESMGFSSVADYVAGKLDWLAAGLPTVRKDERPRVGDIARPDVPTCRIDERLGDVQKRVGESWDACVVVGDERVVLGLLRARELSGDPDAPIEQVMRPGPSTFRPFVGVDEMARLLFEHDVPNAPITTSDGRLVGLLVREDAIGAVRQGHKKVRWLKHRPKSCVANAMRR